MYRSCKAGHTKPLSGKQRDGIKGLDHELMKHYREHLREDDRRQELRWDLGLDGGRARKGRSEKHKLHHRARNERKSKKGRSTGVIDLTKDDDGVREGRQASASSAERRKKRLARLEQELERLKNDSRASGVTLWTLKPAAQPSRASPALSSSISLDAEQRILCEVGSLQERLDEVERVHGQRLAGQAELDEFLYALRSEWELVEADSRPSSPNGMADEGEPEDGSIQAGLRTQEHVEMGKSMGALMEKAQCDAGDRNLPPTPWGVDVDAGGEEIPDLSTWLGRKAAVETDIEGKQPEMEVDDREDEMIESHSSL